MTMSPRKSWLPPDSSRLTRRSPALQSRANGSAAIKPGSEGEAGTTCGPGSASGRKTAQAWGPDNEHSNQAPAGDSDPGHAFEYDGQLRSRPRP